MTLSLLKPKAKPAPSHPDLPEGGVRAAIRRDPSYLAAVEEWNAATSRFHGVRRRVEEFNEQIRQLESAEAELLAGSLEGESMREAIEHRNRITAAMEERDVLLRSLDTAHRAALRVVAQRCAEEYQAAANRLLSAWQPVAEQVDGELARLEEQLHQLRDYRNDVGALTRDLAWERPTPPEPGDPSGSPEKVLAALLDPEPGCVPTAEAIRSLERLVAYCVGRPWRVVVKFVVKTGKVEIPHFNADARYLAGIQEVIDGPTAERP